MCIHLFAGLAPFARGSLNIAKSRRSPQPLHHGLREDFAFGAAGGAFLHQLHDRTHLRAGGGAGFGKGGGDEGVHFLRGQRLGKEALQHGDLGLLFVGEFGASGLGEGFDGILALFDLFADEGDGFRFGNVSRGAGRGFGEEEGRLERPQGGEGGLIFGAHGVFERFAERGLDGIHRATLFPFTSISTPRKVRVWNGNVVCSRHDAGQNKRGFSLQVPFFELMARWSDFCRASLLVVLSTLDPAVARAEGIPSLSRLAGEGSAYLRRAIDSGIDWRAWDTEALAEAARLNKPIFLSIGYFSCHWCTAMEDGSFRDPDAIRILNESFIPVKVDRFERPDLDRLYMRFHEVVARGGGWPLNAWLTPEALPIRTSSFISAEGRDKGRLAKTSEHTTRWWEEEDTASSTRQQARDRMTAFGRRIELTPAPDFVPDEALVASAFSELASQIDPVNGGFGRVPKFTAPARIELVARAMSGVKASSLRAEEGREIIGAMLRGMARGGLRDRLGGGFFRYALDEAWQRPYFEKMALDQALVVRSYLTGFQLLRDPEFADIARETLAYADRELGHPEGAFYNAEHCDSLPDDAAKAPLEGAAYTWTLPEVRQVAAVNAPVLEAFFGLRERGNLPPGGALIQGRGDENLLIATRTLAETAAALDLSAAEVKRRLAEGSAALLAHRRLRPPPSRDPLLITQMNAALASAFVRAGQILGDPALAARGERALRYVRANLWDDKTRTLYRCRTERSPRHMACAEDYAAVIEAALDLYEASGAHEWLAWAAQVQQVFDAQHADAEKGGYFDASRDATDVLLALKTYDDASHFSPNAVAGLNLTRWAGLRPAADDDAKVLRLLAAFGRPLARNPGLIAGLTLVADAHLRPPPRLVIVGAQDAEDARAARRRAWTRDFQRPLIVQLGDEAARTWWRERGGLPESVLNHPVGGATVCFLLRPSGQAVGPFAPAQLDAHWPAPW